MLNWERNRAGLAVPRWNGNLLASRNDPVREARQWAERNAAYVRGVKSAFVLGIGGAFHVLELAKLFPRTKIIAIDSVEELVENAKESARMIARAEFLHFTEPYSIFESDAVREAITRSYAILRHAPSIQCSPELYADAERLLLGRDPQAFFTLLQNRDEDMGFFGRLSFKPVRKRGLAEVQDRKPVTINEIIGAIRDNPGVSDDKARVWLLLSELIR